MLNLIIKRGEFKEARADLNFKIGDSEINNVSITLDQQKAQTIKLTIPATEDKKINKIKITKNSPAYQVSYKIKGIKVIYK